MQKRKSITKKIRFEIFKRDDFKCQYCGKSAPDIVLEIDHIKPFSKGGSNDVLNLVTSCFDCNRGKSDKKLSDMSEVNKQKKQLNILKAKNEQLEMIIKRREEFLDINNKEFEYAKEAFESEAGCNILESGIKILKRVIKKYGIQEVLESIDISLEQYTENSDRFNKIEAICKNRKKHKEHPEYKDFYYIRGIMKNRYNYISEWESLDMIKHLFYKENVSIEEIKQIVLSTKNWTQFKELYIDYKTPNKVGF